MTENDTEKVKETVFAVFLVEALQVFTWGVTKCAWIVAQTQNYNST